MNDKNKIKYNFTTNQVHELIFEQVFNQGQDNDATFEITFVEQLYDFNYWIDKFDPTWQVLCTFERPDGSKTNEMLATLTDGKYYITLPSWITDIEGNVQLTTTILYDDGTRQPFGLVYITVLEGVEPSTSTIEEALYNALLSTVNNINAKTEARVKKTGDTMSGDLDMDGNHIDNVGTLRVLEVVGHDATVSVNSNIDMNDGELRQVGKITGITGHGLTIDDKLKMNGNIIDLDNGNILNVAYVDAANLIVQYIDKHELASKIYILSELDMSGKSIQNINQININEIASVSGEVTVDGDFIMTGHKVYDAGHVDIDEGRQDTLTTAKSVKDYAVHRKLTIGDVELDKAINFLNAISSAEITQTLNEATENLQGALSADDKKLINRLRDLLDVDAEFVDTLQEVLDVFADYPHSTDLLTMFSTKVNTTTKINDIPIGTGMTIKSKDVPFSTTNVETELERLEGAKVNIRGDADLLLDTDKAKIDKIRDNGDGDEFLNDKQEYQIIKANQVKTSIGGTYEGKGVEEALNFVKQIAGTLVLDFGFFTDDEDSVPIFDLGGFV